MNNINKEEDKKEENQNKNQINNKIFNGSNNQNNIKKLIMPEEEYQKMMNKRNLMIKNSKHRPMTLLFGRQNKSQIQNNNIPNSLKNPIFNNNSNMQINNNTNYLTSIETIVEEKYQKDGQTLIVENPNYSMKQLNYKYKTNQLNKIMIIYIRKINELEDKYNFTNEYLSFIIKIFEKLCKPFISSLSDIFTNNIKPNLKYFQDFIMIFNDFSEKIRNIQNKSLDDKLNFKNDQNKLNNLAYLDFSLNNSIIKINNIFSDNFNLTSQKIKNLIINNPLFKKLDIIEIKFSDNYNKILININKLIHRQNKFNDKYKKEIYPYFAGIKQRLNDTTLFQFLTLGKDFIFIESDMLSYINKIYNKISQFLINLEFLLKDSQNIFYDYFEILYNIIKLYYKENKNILNISALLPNKTIINLDNLLKIEDIRNNIEKKYSFNSIIENNDNEQLFNDINHYLLNYRDLLLQYDFVKSDDIEDAIKFNLINYNSSGDFIQFLMRLIPLKFSFKFKDVIELKMNIKRNSGIIKGWRNSLLIITYQGHIFIFDQDGNLSKKELINSIIDEKHIEDIKEKNDEEDLYEVIKNNKLIINYWRSNFGMVKLSSKDNQKLVQFYEDYMGFSQYRPIIIDVINDNNLNILINILSNNKII